MFLPFQNCWQPAVSSVSTSNEQKIKNKIIDVIRKTSGIY